MSDLTRRLDQSIVKAKSDLAYRAKLMRAWDVLGDKMQALSLISQSEPRVSLNTIDALKVIGLWTDPGSECRHVAFELHDWADAGMPVYDVAKHAAHELLLTAAGPIDWIRLPANAFYVRLTPGTLNIPDPDIDVTSLFVARHSASATCGQTVMFVAHGSLPTADGLHFAGAHLSPNSDVLPHPALTALVHNLCIALTYRSDDMVVEDLSVRRVGAVRHVRVRMRTPRIDLAPHVQRFVLEGERAFRSKRGHQVMGFFRRAPGKDEKTVWVRPHFRGGKIGETVEPHVTRIVKTEQR